MTPYIAVDLETTGLDPQTCQILEFAFVAENGDWNTPVEELLRFRGRVIHDVVRGQPYGLHMNSELLKDIASTKGIYLKDGCHYCKEEDVARMICRWLDNYVARHSGKSMRYNLAGKNVASFDLQFLKALPSSGLISSLFQHRIIDVGNLFFDPVQDSRLPDMQECMRRAGLETTVRHNALEDCYDTIRCIRAWHKARTLPKAA